MYSAIFFSHNFFWPQTTNTSITTLSSFVFHFYTYDKIEVMNSSQKIVAIGAGSGVISMVFLVWILYTLLPGVVGVESVFDRVIFALKMNVIAVLPLFIMIATVGNGTTAGRRTCQLRTVVLPRARSGGTKEW